MWFPKTKSKFAKTKPNLELNNFVQWGPSYICYREMEKAMWYPRTNFIELRLVFRSLISRRHSSWLTCMACGWTHVSHSNIPWSVEHGGFNHSWLYHLVEYQGQHSLAAIILQHIFATFNRLATPIVPQISAAAVQFWTWVRTWTCVRFACVRFKVWRHCRIGRP